MTETPAIVCAHIFNNEREVKAVIRHEDGVWQMVCGEQDHPQDCSNFEVVGLGHLTKRQPNLKQLADMPPGWIAERVNDKWLRSADTE